MTYTVFAERLQTDIWLLVLLYNSLLKVYNVLQAEWPLSTLNTDNLYLEHSRRTWFVPNLGTSVHLEMHKLHRTLI